MSPEVISFIDEEESIMTKGIEGLSTQSKTINRGEY